MSEEKLIKETVKQRYSAIAESDGCGCGSSCCGAGDPKQAAAEIGYSINELEDIPVEAMLGLGCGNPIAFVGLKTGETVLDLGSGGGIDVFLAAKKVGANGKVIGVDMSEPMIKRANDTAEEYDYKNVEFRLGDIEELPVENSTVDAIISNCVINLSTQKEQVFKEAYRVLRKGGRLLVSDMMVKGLPEEVRNNILAWTSCVGGAIELEAYTDAIRGAGFTEIEVVNNTEYPVELIKNWITSTDTLDKKEKEELQNLEHTVEGKIKILHAEISAVKT